MDDKSLKENEVGVNDKSLKENEVGVNDKSLKEKAISIKGKLYVEVSQRVLYFNENYPNGKIVTEMLSLVGDEMVLFKATVYPDVEKSDRCFNAYSQARWGNGLINTSSAIENAETSAVGRALAFMGIGVIDGIASVDEMHKINVMAMHKLNIPPNVGDVMEARNQRIAYGQEQAKCKKCGADMKVSKTGNLYCSARCWLNANTPDDSEDSAFDSLLKY